MDSWFTHPWALWLPLLFPALGLLAYLARRRQRRALTAFGRVYLLDGLIAGRGRRRVLRSLVRGLGLVCLCVAIAGPRWGRDWEQATAPGRNIVIALDLSRSMLAEAPSRLERAKSALTDLSYAVEHRGGHRLALVVFAARAKLVCPLTHDYAHFREALGRLDAARPPAEVLPVRGMESGTSFAAALWGALAAHDPGPSSDPTQEPPGFGRAPTPDARFHGYQDVLLLSDGDDPARDPGWVPAANEAKRHGIAVHTIGIGDPERRSPVPLGNGFLEHEGRVVQSRLEEAPLRRIASRTGGTYTPAHTSAVPLGGVFEEQIAARAVLEDGGDALPIYRQRYPWFFAAALGLLGLDLATGRRQRRFPQPRPQEEPS